MPFINNPCLFLIVQDHVNVILKDKWYALTEDEKHEWKEWEDWDAKRYEHQLEIYNQKKSGKKLKKATSDSSNLSIPKKSKSDGAFSIPKKRK